MNQERNVTVRKNSALAVILSIAMSVMLVIDGVNACFKCQYELSVQTALGDAKILVSILLIGRTMQKVNSMGLSTNSNIA